MYIYVIDHQSAYHSISVVPIYFSVVTMHMLFYIIVQVDVCNITSLFLQGYFSGTSQYQFIAETYIVLVLCILFLCGDCNIFVTILMYVYVGMAVPDSQRNKVHVGG